MRENVIPDVQPGTGGDDLAVGHGVVLLVAVCQIFFDGFPEVADGLV